MRILLLVGVTCLAVAAQAPVARITNATRPSAPDFQIGDRFEIVVTGTAGQPVSVRTTLNGRTDWGPVIGRIDSNGRWSTSGQFEKSDFGDWSEVWTVGGRAAASVLHFSVDPPCLESGQRGMMAMSRIRAVTCDTAGGTRTFATASDTEPFRTPDGRVIPGRLRSGRTAEQFQMEFMESLILAPAGNAKILRKGQLGARAAALIQNLIGENALTGDEVRNVLSIIHAACERPDRIAQAEKDPSATLLLLRRLADATEQESLKQDIAKTVAFVQAQ
ncbi:MAG TPA: hypothetical protein VN893_09025 [Bryobacteraceae bacterium]|nr:hypothetical protein [Bryobacteraceae bacterium]